MKTFPTLRRAPATLSVDLEPFQRSSGGVQVRSEAIKGALWRITLSYELLEEEDARDLEAFFADVGSATFTLPASVYSTQEVGATASGTSLTDNSVNVTTPRLLLAGQFLAVNGELKVLTKDQAGASLRFAPAMRKTSAGQAQVITGPVSVMCGVDDDGFVVSYQTANIYSVTVSLLEVNPV